MTNVSATLNTTAAAAPVPVAPPVASVVSPAIDATAQATSTVATDTLSGAPAGAVPTAATPVAAASAETATAESVSTRAYNWAKETCDNVRHSRIVTKGLECLSKYGPLALAVPASFVATKSFINLCQGSDKKLRELTKLAAAATVAVGSCYCAIHDESFISRDKVIIASLSTVATTAIYTTLIHSKCSSLLSSLKAKLISADKAKAA